MRDDSRSADQKLPDWPDKPYSQTLRSASKNANGSAILVRVAFLSIGLMMSSQTNNRWAGDRPIRDVDHKQAWRSWKY